MLERNLELEEHFFNEKFYFSYSSLQKLINDPQQFYKDYILGEREDGDAVYFKEGELFHCFLLEPERLDEKFYVNTVSVPAGSAKDIADYIFKTFVEILIEKDESLKGVIQLGRYEKEILAYMEEIDVYQSLVDSKRKDKNGKMLTGDQKRLEKAITKESVAYFKALQEAVGKTIVDIDMVQKAKEKAKIMATHPDVMKLMSPGNDIDLRFEQELKSECDNKPFTFGLKGFVDLIRIDEKEQVIHIIDFKTTSKTLKKWQKGFEDSEYMYWLQPIVYKELILSYVPEKDRGNWNVKIWFPVIDKNNKVYVFPVTPKSFLRWNEQAKGVFEIADWHLSSADFSLPYEFAKGLAVL